MSAHKGGRFHSVDFTRRTAQTQRNVQASIGIPLIRLAQSHENVIDDYQGCSDDQAGRMAACNRIQGLTDHIAIASRFEQRSFAGSRLARADASL